MTREIALYTLEGVRDAEVTTHYFTTDDGLGLSLLRFRRPTAEPAKDAVMIIHGLTTSTDMFIMPEHENLVSYLLDHGHTDVWCLDFRMSNRHSYNLFPHSWTLDDCALYDYPPAVELVRRETGNVPLHVISHCLGAQTFVMAVFAKTVEGITSVIANSTALTPRVPRWSKVKIRFAPDLVEKVFGFPNLNPRWSEEPGFRIGKAFSKVVSMFHRECDVPACGMLSLMWGTGFPALYSHENLADVTHRRGGDLYGATSLNYYRHVNRMVRAGSRPLKYDFDEPRHASLPDDYFTYAREIETPVLLTTGENNKVFSDSNQVCYQRLQALGCTRHELHVFPNYGHQDPFMGKDVARDIFPTMLEWIDRHSPSRESSPGDRKPAVAA